MTEFKHRRVVLIGGSSGIGLATAQAAARREAEIILVGRSEERLADAARQINSNTDIHQIVADISDESAVQALFQSIGRYDHLVMTAADLAYASIQQFPTANVERVLQSKFWGPFYAAKHGTQSISSQGSITFFSGVAAWKPSPGASIVAAVNGALVAFARALALELAPVRVNVVAPGVVVTPSWDCMPEGERREFLEATAQKLPVQRVGQPQDVAQTVLYLMQNRFTTGTVIHVDGGAQII